MDSLYQLFPLLGKFNEILCNLFRTETRPTRGKLALLILSFLVMDSCPSVRKSWTSFLSRVSGKDLKSYYHLLARAKANLTA